MSADYAPALDLSDPRIGWGGWVPTNRHWIIVHGTAGDATVQAVQQTFISNAARGAPSSTHFAVGEDGTVAQYVPLSGVAWGNGPITGPAGTAIAGTGNAHDAWWDTSAAYPGNANPPTVSIEHCKSDTSNSAALTPAQQAASFALIAYLCGKLGIPRRVYGTPTPVSSGGGVTGHFSMDPVNRAFCPGTYPWQALQDYLNGATPPMSIVLDHDAAGNIIGAHNATGEPNPVGGGMAQTINQNNWLSAQITVPELHNLAGGETVAVLRGTVKVAMTYTQSDGVEVSGGNIAAAVQDLYTLWRNEQTTPSGVSIPLTAGQVAQVKAS